MKIIFLSLLVLFFVITPVYGQLLSDATGLINRLDVQTGGHNFEVEIVANFDVIDHEFNKDEKRLTIFINSELENNLGEIIIPQLLLGGNFTFYLNDIQSNQEIKFNDRISFITLNFTGSGNNKIDIIATNTFAGVDEKSETLVIDESTSEGGGCLIATATYGTELAPQIQQLRELRDNKLLQTKAGTSFINTFNDVYYSFSPYIADYERENSIFREMVKIAITPMISSLSILNYVNMDSEVEVLEYGISLILLNVGMYFVAPVIVLVRIRQKF